MSARQESIGPAVAARCWCGSEDLALFSPDYYQCTNCGTLVLKAPPTDTTRVVDEATSFYGLHYFNEHARQLGHPVLSDRARLDLPERCAFWLRTLLEHRAPPGRTLEIGCANGAFVGLLAAAGFDATGLDLSPAVTALAQGTFQVPILTGPIEEQALAPSSFDVLVMMDVLEHLPDPVGTLQHCASVLSRDGILLAQTPRLDPSASYEELRERRDPFYSQFLQNRLDEHLFVFSEHAARQALARAGFEYVQFLPAIFAQYDMSFIASRMPIRAIPELEWRAALRRSRSGRIVEALLDARERGQQDLAALQRNVDEIERDRAARLDVIHGQQREIDASQREIDARQREIEGIRTDLATALQHVQELTRELSRLHSLETEHAVLLRRLGPLAKLLRVRPGTV